MKKIPKMTNYTLKMRKVNTHKSRKIIVKKKSQFQKKNTKTRKKTKIN